MEERFDYDGLLGVNSDLREQLADAQATVETLQRERDEAIREHGKESGFWGRSCARLLDKRDELQAALDAEREKGIMGNELYISDGDIEALKQFYQVTSRRALIAAMLHHIDKLQIESRDRLQLALASVRQVRQ